MLTQLCALLSSGSIKFPLISVPGPAPIVANGPPRESGDRPRSGWKLLVKSLSRPVRISFFL